ncbi:hypothetical protein GXM_00204 [Nostoc sphaeroides CCNUC1]|uniref:Uncharacterized protein n=1 Tax=Nostoc sphaeroides CCNUC1 TaxID=2653204 RepID=A0A5P8VR26_9NOSO|nr:hypothetical protein GXM_00204 [Nostoc sphaeroides CCNUC1]
MQTLVYPDKLEGFKTCVGGFCLLSQLHSCEQSSGKLA